MISFCVHIHNETSTLQLLYPVHFVSQIAGISVGRPSSDYAGSIVDSGTTFTYLPSAAYVVSFIYNLRSLTNPMTIFEVNSVVA